MNTETKMKDVDSLQIKQKIQEIQFGCQFYKQIGYTEWIDYYSDNKIWKSNPTAKSVNNKISLSSEDNFTKRICKSKPEALVNGTEIKSNEEENMSRNNPKILLKCKSRNQLKNHLPNVKPFKEDKDSSESDISFDLCKKKVAKLYSNDIAVPVPQVDKFKDIDVDETPEPDHCIAATEQNIVAYFDQIFKTETDIPIEEAKTTLIFIDFGH